MKKKLLLSLPLLVLYFFWTIGSFSKVSSWEDASGFNEIPIENRPGFYKPETSEDPEIYWLGHGGHFIKWQGINILLDPILNTHSAILPRLTPAPIKPEELPEIDYVLLGHMHYDHYDEYTLENIKVIKNIILPSKSEDFLTSKIKNKSNIIPLKENESYKNFSLEIVALKTLHNGSRNHPFSSSYHASAYLIRLGGKSIYFSGDTGYGPQFKALRKKYGSPDIAILPIGAYEPYFILKDYHLNPADAVKASMDLGAGITIPTHFGTFRMSLESPGSALPKFVHQAKLDSISINISRNFTN
jgi:L-ascorbate metabolism protein UlaG (beta-lactamase superfamily)